jgi:hypothetical protein
MVQLALGSSEQLVKAVDFEFDFDPLTLRLKYF